MKKISLFLVAVLFQSTVFGQTETFSKDYYQQKSDSKKNAGLLLAFGGTILIVS